MKQENHMIILFGATGDLTKRKLIPALYNLHSKGKLREDTPIVCVSRRDITKEQFIKLLDLEETIPFLEEDILPDFLKLINYVKLDLEKNDLSAFTKNIKEIEKKYHCSGNMIFYLAVSPLLFEKSTEIIKSSGLLNQKGWKRVVFEKPFGQDLRSAKEINQHIKSIFDEDQIYRIDHFLGKELVQNISIMRFTNTLLEPQWNSKYIDHIQIILSENFGIEDRGAFYDQYGAIKDVLQNHMLQLLALIAMESPKKLVSKHLRDEKLNVLKSIEKIKPENVVIGQYEGYKKEEGVGNNSKTETFAALKLFINNERWKNVPFYLITGKNMRDRMALLHIQFKKTKCLLFQDLCDFKADHLTIEIQPNEGFHVHMNSKIPGRLAIKSVKMDYCHKCTFGLNTPEAYENLFVDIAKGDQSTFVRTDEIEESWKVIDPLKDFKLPVHSYQKGGYPEQADKMIQRDNREWHLKE